MLNRILKSSYFPCFILLTVAMIGYALCVPGTIQSGDTGELVTNSYFLRISHPPGYHLWTLLYHLPVKYIGASNPYLSASLFTVVLSLIWIGILAFNFPNRSHIILLGVLASSYVIWKYSVLPDVFALHALFLTLVFWVFIKPEMLSKPWMIFLISLCVANHHTVIFAFPLFAFALYKNFSKSTLLYSIIFGLISLSSYLLILKFHPTDYGSWASIQNFSDVINHFLRKEYGTFKLQDRNEAGDSWLGFFLTQILKNSWSLVLIAIFIFAKHIEIIRREKKRLGMIAFSLVSYLIVFSVFGGISLNHEGELIAERFLIHPTLFLFFMILFILKVGEIELPKALLILGLVNIGTNVISHAKPLNYSNNTSVEDYLVNSLNTLPPQSIYYTYGDTIGFGTYYLKDVLGLRPDVIHIHPSWGFKWGPQKFTNSFPNIGYKAEDDLYKNIRSTKMRFFTNFNPGLVPEDMRLSYYGLLFEISPYEAGKTVNPFQCEQKYSWKQRPDIGSFTYFDMGRRFDLLYGQCDFTKAQDLIRNNDFQSAIGPLQKSVELSPFNAKFQNGLCELYKKTQDRRFQTCENHLEVLLTEISEEYY